MSSLDMKRRPTWDEYFYDMARLVSSRSTCIKAQHGAVIVRERQVLSTGYNGVPRKIEHCVECERVRLQIPSGTRYETCRSIHAEMNAVVQAARNGININESEMYITGTPCIMCARTIINAGITVVHCGAGSGSSGAYQSESELLLKEAGIEVVHEGN